MGGVGDNRGEREGGGGDIAGIDEEGGEDEGGDDGGGVGEASVT